MLNYSGYLPPPIFPRATATHTAFHMSHKSLACSSSTPRLQKCHDIRSDLYAIVYFYYDEINKTYDNILGVICNKLSLILLYIFVYISSSLYEYCFQHILTIILNYICTCDYLQLLYFSDYTCICKKNLCQNV